MLSVLHGRDSSMIFQLRYEGWVKFRCIKIKTTLVSRETFCIVREKHKQRHRNRALVGTTDE